MRLARDVENMGEKLWWEKLRERFRRYRRRWENNIKMDLKWDGKP